MKWEEQHKQIAEQRFLAQTNLDVAERVHPPRPNNSLTYEVLLLAPLACTYCSWLIHKFAFSIPSPVTHSSASACCFIFLSSDALWKYNKIKSWKQKLPRPVSRIKLSSSRSRRRECRRRFDFALPPLDCCECVCAQEDSPPSTSAKKGIKRLESATLLRKSNNKSCVLVQKTANHSISTGQIFKELRCFSLHKFSMIAIKIA